MFRKHYKQAYNKFEGDRTQIAKILAAANTEMPYKKKRQFSFRYGTAFAAVLVLCISVYSLPQLRESTQPIKEMTGAPAEKIAIVPDENVVIQPSPKNESEPKHEQEINAPDTIATKKSVPAQTTPKGYAQAKGEEKSEGKALEKQDAINVAAANAPSFDESEEVPEMVAAKQPALAKAPAASGDEANVVADTESAVPAALATEDIPLDSVAFAGSGSGAMSRMTIPETYSRYFEDGSYATVTIYQENENIENVFSTATPNTIAGAQTIINEFDSEVTILVKTENSYAEITGYNLVEENITTLVSEIPH